MQRIYKGPLNKNEAKRLGSSAIAITKPSLENSNSVIT